MNKHIEYWLDATSDPSAPKWCVSICWESGDEFLCLSVHETRAQAFEAAKLAARFRNLKLKVHAS